MMKTIFLLRHAQALPATSSGDFERKLSPFGSEDALALGEYMQRKNYEPEYVICSSARRTKETFAQVSEAYDALDVRFSKEVYNAGRNDLLEIIQGADESLARLMLIAHNPAIYELVAGLAKKGAERLLSGLAQGYQPATLSVIETSAESWADIAPNNCTLIDLANPLDYNAAERPTRWM